MTDDNSHSKARNALVPERLRPRKEPGQERSHATVDAILDAAARVLVRAGYPNLDTNEVAEVAGVSVGSLYQYFPHKDALVAALVRRQAAAEAAFMAEYFATLSPADLRGSIRALVDGVFAFRAKDRALQLALLGTMPHIGRFEELAERVKDTVAPLRALLEIHRREVVREDLDLACYVVVNVVHSLTHDGIMPPPARVDEAVIAREIVRIVIAYLTSPELPSSA